MTRAGRTNQIEQLLIGTLYSQYASRKTVLSGTSVLRVPAPVLLWYKDQSQEGKRFLLTEAVERLREAESEIKVVEMSPDEYTTEDE